MSDELEKGSSIDISILIAINTEAILNRSYPVSKEKTRPTMIDHDHQFMICYDPRGKVTGQGSGDLVIPARRMDQVSFYATSLHNDSDNAVILYNLVHQSGDHVLDLKNLSSRTFQRKRAAEPNPDSSDGLPAVHVPRDFHLIDTRVTGSGKEDYLVYFALYTLDDDGETQSLRGYYGWDPTIKTLG
ncbi:inclusion body family protein [Burkholderia pseudomallei]|uniref:inclusion body family protein n=1 Tax=Burkholderia pseudomallei TaxID=28450 RepID=UPI00160B6411|nr:inclusion body family protein [Burkholderia pseudomallei]